MKLENMAQEVEEIFIKCLYGEDELIDGKPTTEPIIVNGIKMNVGFSPRNINKYKDKINSFLDITHETFKEGWSFLNLCLDKNKNLWTGSHSTMEKLLLLGLAIERIEYCCEKNMWEVLPGGMPYIIIK